MKRFLFVLALGCLCSLAAFAQQNPVEDQARIATDELTTLYQLNENQVGEMFVIQLRKYTNLAEIADLKQSDYLTYIQKLKSIERGINASIEWMLDGDIQKRAHYKKLTDLRLVRADIARRMREEGATPQEIEIALQLAYYEE